MIKNDKTYSVYMHKCPNEMIYVGCTSTTPSRRWNGGHGYDTNELFAPQIRQFGWDNIKHLVVAKGLDKNTAHSVERFLITLTKKEYSMNIGDRVFFWEDCFRQKDASCLFADGKAFEFYGNAFNQEAFRWLVLEENQFFSIRELSSVAETKEETPNLKPTNMKWKKAKALRSKSVYGVKIEVMLDTRYKHNNGTFPVCVRVYKNKKYKWLKTGFTMTHEEYCDMSYEDDAIIGKMFEAQCQKVRDCAAKGIEYDLSMAVETKDATANGCYTLTDLIIEKSTLGTNNGTQNNYKSVVKVINKIYPKGIMLSDVRTSTMRDLYNKLLNIGYKPATLNIYLSIIRASINYGIYKGYLKQEQYPFKTAAMEVDKITLPKSDKRDENYLTKDEMRKVWDWFLKTKNKWAGCFLFSYLHGGMNLADMMDLRFNDFWFDEGGFAYQRNKTKGKNNFKVCVPATTWTTTLFDTMGITPVKGELVFGDLGYNENNGGYFKRKGQLSNCINHTLKGLGEKLGIDKSISMTVARHSFATIATKERMPYSLIERAMGHSLGGVASHYIGSFSVEEMRPDFEKLL